MIDFGTVKPGTTLRIPFHTFSSDDPSASMTITGLAVTDIEIYKDGSATQRASDSGYSLLDDGIDFDGITGIHAISIDLADNSDANFYEAGSQYWVIVSSITLDAATINFIAATFRIGYEGSLLDTTIATLASQTSFTLEEGSADDNAYRKCVAIVHDLASAVQVALVYISQYTGATKTVTLAADPAIFTMAAGDNISIMPRIDVGGALDDLYSYAASAAAWGSINSGIVFRGVVSAADPGVSFTIAGLADQGAGAFIDSGTPWYAYVFRDAGGAAAAPQGEQQLVTGYTSATGLFTTTAFTVPVAVGDDVIIMSGRIATVPEIKTRVELALPAVAPDGAGGLPTTTKITDARLGALTDLIDGGRLDLILDAIAVDVAGLDGAAMRGTDNAALAVTALSSVVWTDEKAGFVDVAISSRGTGTALDAAGVRTAVGLGAANLDTQLADLPTVDEFEARTLEAAAYFDPAADTVAQVTTVDTITDKAGFALTTAERTAIANAWMALASAIDGKTPQQALRYMAAVLGGKISGAGTGTEKCYGLDGSTERVRFTVDEDGNRTAASYDP